MIIEKMMTPNYKMELCKGDFSDLSDVIIDEDNKIVLTLKNSLIKIYSLETREYLTSIKKNKDSVIIYRIWLRDSIYNVLTSEGLESLDPFISKFNLIKKISFSLSGVPFIKPDSLISPNPKFIGIRSNGKLFGWDPWIDSSRDLSDKSVSFVPSSDDREFLFDANSSFILFVVGSKIKNQEEIIFMRNRSPWVWKLNFTVHCLAVHPHDYSAATGDGSGKILIWKSGSKGDFVRAIYHWHSLPPRSLAWNFDGFLFSGGREEVFIKWHQDYSKPSATVPRLGGVINKIYFSPSFVLCQLADNSLIFLNSGSLYKDFQLCGPDFSSKNFKLFPPLSSIVFPYDDRMLLFIDSNSKKEILRLDVARENKIIDRSSLLKRNKRNTPTLNFEISDDNTILVTVKIRDDGLSRKFSIWKYSDSYEFFETTTWIEKGESDDISINLSFVSSTNQLLFWGSTPNQIKVWTSESGIYYKCASLSYKDFSPKCVSSSEDGSVISAGFGKYATLWANSDNEIKFIGYLNSSSDIVSLLIGKSSNSNVLFGASIDGRITVWNILTMSLLRTFENEKSGIPRLLTIPNSKLIGCLSQGYGIKILDKNSCLGKLEGQFVFGVFNKNIDAYVFDNKTQSVIKISWDEHSNLNDVDMEEDILIAPRKSTPKRIQRLHETPKVIPKEPTLTFENVQNPLSAFSRDFLDNNVLMYKNTFLFD